MSQLILNQIFIICRQHTHTDTENDAHHDIQISFQVPIYDTSWKSYKLLFFKLTGLPQDRIQIISHQLHQPWARMEKL